MQKRAKKTILIAAAAAAGATLAVGATAAFAATQGADPAAKKFQNVAVLNMPAATTQPVPQAAPAPAHTKKAVKAVKARPKHVLPYGTATATSFWDSQTASGKPMSFQTLASPYWPLGTKVKVSYQGKSQVGVVEDFGPAEWAVAQHDIPAIVDISSEMMQSLSGTGDNTVHVTFQVLSWGHGGVYRHSGTGYALAYGHGK
jgi:hypothetical protein